MDFKDTKYGNLSGKVYNGDIKAHSGVSSLKGAPEVVEGDFMCYNCNNLKNLKGAPREVKYNFDCSYCRSLEELTGVPKIVKGKFDCSMCENLQTLKGAPEIVDGEFNCKSCRKLKNLDPLLLCVIKGEVIADSKLLEDYLRKKPAVEKHGYDKAMEIFNMMDELV